jgi:hypothetical protein
MARGTRAQRNLQSPAKRLGAALHRAGFVPGPHHETPLNKGLAQSVRALSKPSRSAGLWRQRAP